MPPKPDQYGRYQLIEEIGRGGMGIVYKAFDPDAKRYVALKVLNGLTEFEERQRFQKEIAATAQLAHPSIVTIHNSGISEGGRPFQVLEYLEGQSLQDWALSEQATIPRIVTIMTRVAAAVDFAHTKGFIHRDIKAANIFLCESGEAKLLDFGIAKCLFEMQGQSLTQSGVVLGSLPFMAPEQLRNDPITTSLDVYALGATLYFLLTQQTPFDASQSPIRLALDIEEKTPKSPQNINPEVSRELADICLKALEKSPKKRFASASDFAKALEELGKNKSSQKSSRSFTIACVFALLALLALLFLDVDFNKEAQTPSRNLTKENPAPILEKEVKNTPAKREKAGRIQLAVTNIGQSPLFVEMNNDGILDFILVGRDRFADPNSDNGEQLIALSGKTGAVIRRSNEIVSKNTRPQWQSYSKKNQAIVVGIYKGDKRVPALAWIDQRTGKTSNVVTFPGLEGAAVVEPIRVTPRDREGTGRWGWTIAITTKETTFFFHLSKRGNIENQTNLRKLGLTGDSMSYHIAAVPQENKAPIQYFFQLNNSIFSYTFDPSRKTPRRWLRGLRDGLPRSSTFRPSPNSVLEVLELIRFRVNDNAGPISHLRIRNIKTGLVQWPSGARYKHSLDIVWAEYFTPKAIGPASFLSLAKEHDLRYVLQLYNHRGKKIGRKTLIGALAQPALFRQNKKQFFFLHDAHSKTMKLYSLPQLALRWEENLSASKPQIYCVDIDQDGDDELVVFSERSAVSIIRPTPK
ncbi:MAG: serine/threonine-protein kinase [Planctomycetota bacterium]|nr:serine/threonine-protein kinase [Planctomycetota bacterium]